MIKPRFEPSTGEAASPMSKWADEKHFCSWLGLAHKHGISGGKVLKSRTLKSRNRAAQAVLRAACAFGAFYRRFKGRLGPAQALVAARQALPSSPCGACRPRFPCAAPHPSLSPTGAWSSCNHPFRRGQHEGTETFRGRPETRLHLWVVTMAMVTEPQDVCGAATHWPRQSPETKAGHRIDCRLPMCWHTEKNV